MSQTESTKAIRRHERVSLYRQRHAEVARLLDLAQEDLLSPEERATLEGKQVPAGGVI